MRTHIAQRPFEGEEKIQQVQIAIIVSIQIQKQAILKRRS